jgi:anaerobic selenocysteine-containing dehydrogenase
MTDTARRADLFFPTTLMLEQEDIVGSYLHHYIHYVEKVVEPPGEARSDFRILSDLGKRLDPPVILSDPERCFRASLDFPFLARIADWPHAGSPTHAGRVAPGGRSNPEGELDGVRGWDQPGCRSRAVGYWKRCAVL